jgi:poly(A) polymerase
MDIFQMEPCKQVGILKNEIKEAILEGKIKNDYNDAYAFMLEQAEEMGIEAKKRG